MAVYCEKCGAKLNEKDAFCEMCGAPVEKDDVVKKDRFAPQGSGNGAKNYKMIGIAAIAVAALLAVGFAVKGIGGAQKDGGEEIASDKTSASEEDDVLEHLKPWMGEWVVNFQLYPEQGSGFLNNSEIEGLYNGYLLTHGNSKGRVHVDEQYIDFSDYTKDQKDRFPVSALKYYETEYGADAFEDENSGVRIVFYEHFRTYDGSEDYGEVLKIQAYVGMEEPEVNYIDAGNGEKIPMGFKGHYPGPDGWAVDISVAFVKLSD